MKKSELESGVRWNLFSYVILGSLTVVSYFLLTWRYGEGILGAYNIVMSVYMICGHIGVFGLQSAAIYFIPRQLNDKIRLGQYFSSFLLLSIAVSSLLAWGICSAAGILGDGLFASDWVSEGLRTVSPSIILFSVNKLICGYVNGLGRMQEFAVLQCLRYLLLMAYIGLHAALCLDVHLLFYAFPVAEIGVAGLGSFFLMGRIAFARPRRACLWVGVRFGSRAMLGNVITDINTRVDMMMLGILCDDSAVGLYSFVTIIAEGMFSVLFVFRNNYNPYFSELLFRQRFLELASFLREQKKKIRKIFMALGITILIGYTAFCFLALEEAFLISIPAVAMILIGCIIMAPYFIVGNVCTLLGKPFTDTCITLATILVNMVLNYFFILCWGIQGAALATSVSYLVFSALTHTAVRQACGIQAQSGKE